MEIKSVALVTAQTHMAGEVDLPLMRAAFADRKIAFQVVTWENPEIEWNRFDLILLMKPWNWPYHLKEFDAFLTRMQSLPVRNSVPVIRWNLDKVYIGELANLGVPMIPTTYAKTIDEVLQAIQVINKD